MMRSWYLAVAVLLLCWGRCAADPVKNVESNYLYQMEQATLVKFWKRDMNYIMNLLRSGELPIIEHIPTNFTRCMFHKLRFKNITHHTENLKLVFDPVTRHVNFSQDIGFAYELDLIWEFTIGFFPISGTATFKGVGIKVNYTLNITQPYEGKLLVPGFDCDWHVTSAVVNSPLGSLFGIPQLVAKMFSDVMENDLMDYVKQNIEVMIPLKYEEFYAPHEDVITFSGLDNQQVTVMRRYKRLFLDAHLLAVIYQERVEPMFEGSLEGELKEQSTTPLTPSTVTSTTGATDSGILRRYMRDFRVFEQIANKTLGFIKEYKLVDADLPVQQKIRLNATSMTMMLPKFIEKFGLNANISLKVTGFNKQGLIVLNRVDSQLVRLGGLVMLFEFYAKNASSEVLFLNATLSST